MNGFFGREKTSQMILDFLSKLRKGIPFTLEVMGTGAFGS